MEKGISYGKIPPQLYPEVFKEPNELLLLVRDAVPSLRNPAVERALTEVRKVVNAIVHSMANRYEIRIEMARELRKSRKERQEIHVRTGCASEKGEAKAKILKECGIQNPSRSVLKFYCSRNAAAFALTQDVQSNSALSLVILSSMSSTSFH